MRCSSRIKAGSGLAIALVLWVVAMVLINAVASGQATSSAFLSMVRMIHARTAVFAARSALEEAVFAVRHPQSGVSKVQEAFESGAASGTLYEPVETRRLYRPQVDSPEGVVTIERVEYEFVGGIPRPSNDPKEESFLIDFKVKVRFDNATASLRGLGRTMRRRFPGKLAKVVETMGPKKGQVVYVILTLARDPVLEVSDA